MPLGGPALGQRRDHVLIQRLAGGAGLLGAVEHGDVLDRLRQRRHEGSGVPGAEQPHLQHAHLLPFGHQLVDRLLDHADARAHNHDHAVGVGSAGVVEQVILPAKELGKLVHVLLHHAGAGGVERVAGLAGLEEHVRVLGRAAEFRPLGRKGPLRWAATRSMSIIARTSSSVSCSILFTSCEMRKPS